MQQHKFRDGSLMEIDGAFLKIYDETGGEVMEGLLAVELPEDQQLMFVAAALYHDGFQIQFTEKGFLGSQIKSMLTLNNASFADRAIVWASGHLNELQALIALCSDIGPMLLPTSGGGMSVVPKPAAQCLK